MRPSLEALVLGLEVANFTAIAAVVLAVLAQPDVVGALAQIAVAFDVAPALCLFFAAKHAMEFIGHRKHYYRISLRRDARP
jgi:hypothetical protein